MPLVTGVTGVIVGVAAVTAATEPLARAVVFAGLTAIVALVGLAVVDIPLLTKMRLAAALTVSTAVVIALTPAACSVGFAGRRVHDGRIPGLRARDLTRTMPSARPWHGDAWA